MTRRLFLDPETLDATGLHCMGLDSTADSPLVMAGRPMIIRNFDRQGAPDRPVRPAKPSDDQAGEQQAARDHAAGPRAALRRAAV